MSLHPTTSFRRAGFALATIAGLMAGGSAYAQTASRPTPINAPASQGVPEAQCAAFASYLVDELNAFPKDLSAEFRRTGARFLRAGCASRDADGEVQIILMNAQDAASWRTARKRMGTFDIMGVSGVKGCVRPDKGVCPATTSSNPSPTGGG